MSNQTGRKPEQSESASGGKNKQMGFVVPSDIPLGIFCFAETQRKHLPVTKHEGRGIQNLIGADEDLISNVVLTSILGGI